MCLTSQQYSFICTQLNGSKVRYAILVIQFLLLNDFKYSYPTRIFLFCFYTNIAIKQFYLLTVKLFQVSLCNTNTGCPRGVMVKAMDSGIVEREFALQLRYYVHFRANTHGKGMNPLILPAMG